MREFRDQQLTRSIIGAFYEVFGVLEHGLLESLYSAALEVELRARGHLVAREVLFAVRYKGTVIGRQRIDMLVDGRVIVEIKATVDLHPSAIRQLRSYLQATGVSVGLILHFGPKPEVRRLDRSET